MSIWLLRTVSATEENQYSDEEEESDDISVESIDPKDNLTEVLSVDLGKKLRRALSSAAASGYTPENRNKLYKALYEYQVSQFDSVLENSGFTKLNKQQEMIDWKGSCQPDISKDTKNGGLICVATHDISVLDRRTVSLDTLKWDVSADDVSPISGCD
jgi:hypothetical protein